MIIRLLTKLLILAVLMFLVDRALGDVLKKGLDRYDGLNKKPEILCIGHSRTIFGIDETQLAAGLGVSVAKYARHGADIFERLIMLEDYFRRQPQRPRIVVYDVDPTTFNRQKISENSYTRFFPYIDTPEVAEYLETKCSDSIECTSRKYIQLLRFNNPWLVRSSIKGYLGKQDGYQYGRVDYSKAVVDVNSWKNNAEVFDTRNYDCILNTIRFLRSNDVKIIFLYIPTLDLYNRHNSADEQFMKETLSSLAAKDDGILFLNYSQRYQSVHEYFIDMIHLNREGQIRVTDDLIKDLKPLLESKPNMSDKNSGV